MKSPVCVDASLVLRWLLPEDYSPEALSLLEEWRRQKMQLVAPSHLAFEVTSVLRNLVYLQVIPQEIGEGSFEHFRRIKAKLYTRLDLFPLAWRLAKEFNRPTAYDTSYLALAQMLNCDFWTADKRLYNAVKDKLSWVKWIGSSQLQDKL